MHSFSAKADLFKLCLQSLHADQLARRSISPAVYAASLSTRTESETRATRNPRGWRVAFA